jgi:hypothetical protein
MLELISAAAISIALAQNPSTLSNPSNRSITLTSLYASFATLQALDVHSTLSVLSAGGREANPAMRGVAGHPGSLIAVKAASGAAVIWLSEKVRKKHPRGAVALMAVLNSVMATVVAHNYSMR